jgi:hypothetical protein
MNVDKAAEAFHDRWIEVGHSWATAPEHEREASRQYIRELLALTAAPDLLAAAKALSKAAEDYEQPPLKFWEALEAAVRAAEEGT